MKNALLLLFGVAMVGLTASFIVWDLREKESRDEPQIAAAESLPVSISITEAPASGADVTDEEAEASATGAASGESVDTANEIETESERAAEETAATQRLDDEESAAFQIWKPLSGKPFEAKLIWVSQSGISLRFEKPDGSTFVYPTEFLEPEHHDAVRSMVIAKNSTDGQGF